MTQNSSIKDQSLDVSHNGSTDVERLVEESDTGVRTPLGMAGKAVLFIAFMWSVFQLYYASPIAYMPYEWWSHFNIWMHDLVGFDLKFESETRSIHLGFAILLGFIFYPAYANKVHVSSRKVAHVMFGAGLFIILLSCYQLFDFESVYLATKHTDVINDQYRYYTMLAMIGVPCGLICGLIASPLVYRYVLKRQDDYNVVLLILSMLGFASLGFILNYVLESVPTMSANKELIRSYRELFVLYAVGVALFFMAQPAYGRHSLSRVSPQDWLVAGAACFCALHNFIFMDAINEAQGLASLFHMVVAGVGLVLLIEAARRVLGAPLAILAVIFLTYSLTREYLPQILDFGNDISLRQIISKQWALTDGVFGNPIGVSTKFVYLFVLFGALLETAGAGNYFIRLAFALVGHMRGGPAKAAVMASGMTGLVSGSSIANVVTTGTFTIPLMRKVGFSAEKAGAVEVASSVNGQIMPPVMGAAAFLMIEYVGIPYAEVIKHAALPAVISYIALLYLVHLEAMKNDFPVIPAREKLTFYQSFLRWGIILTSVILFAVALFYLVSFLGWLYQSASPFLSSLSPILGIIIALSFYVYSVYLSTKVDEKTVDTLSGNSPTLPPLKEAFISGIHYLIPVATILWCIVIEKFSASTSVLWSIMVLLFMLVTQNPLKAWILGQKGGVVKEAKKIPNDIYQSFITAARNMISIAIATAAAGTIEGTVTLTNLGDLMTDIVFMISGGEFLLVLIFTALISIVLGMGLPTTANYIVVSSIMVPVLISLGSQNGVIIPLIAAHLFVFYFGLMADVTPPVGLASFAAAAVAGGDPLKTGFQAFFYSMRTVTLPFFFIFNTQLLLIGVDGIWDFALAAGSALIAMLVFAAATQGYFFARCKWWEVCALLLVAFTIFRPGFWMDSLYDPFSEHKPDHFVELLQKDVGSLEFTDIRVVAGRALKKEFSIQDPKQAFKKRTVPIALDELNGSLKQKLRQTGINRLKQDKNGNYVIKSINEISLGKQTPIVSYGVNRKWVILSVETPNPQPAKEWFYIPAFLLLLVVIMIQRNRQKVSIK